MVSDKSDRCTDGWRVLLVDDDEDIRRDYARLLLKLGFEVVTAEDGRAAVEALEDGAFDLILSDVSMPRLSGTDFLREVRALDMDVPVVLMTGAPELSSAIKALDYGALAYLEKPVGMDALANVARRARRMHELARLRREAMEVIGAHDRQVDDRAALEARLSSAIEKLWIAYQPIVSLPDSAVFAFEALLRSDEPTMRSPLDILDAAERLGRLHDLGRRVREVVAAEAAEAPPDVLLFVNLHPADLNDDTLYGADAPLAPLARRVVLEITERASLEHVPNLVDKVRRLRAQGYRIAVDDLGAGYAGLASFAQLDPEFVKLDMSLVRGLDASERKRSVVRAMTRLCEHELSIRVVSEGVETPQERDSLRDQGCELLQGYLFARPARGFPAAAFTL